VSDSLARLPREHVHVERVRFGDLDAMRHLNNVVFLRYFESARIAFISELLPEHNPTQPEGDPSGVIFAECHINYRSPVYYDEELHVISRVGEIRRSSFQITFEMRVGDRLAAEGYGWLVGFDYEAQKASPLPDALRDVLTAAAA
jgi:acyl-CoA thioester hydrolase